MNLSLTLQLEMSIELRGFWPEYCNRTNNSNTYFNTLSL